ncbi:MAG: hypothetical protein KH438_13630, partial [Oscillibacter sp.]|nr:hypothetical protein [Oscillibacter sp.]
MLEQEEQRDELLEKIEDLISRKRYAELRDLLLPLEAQDIAGLFMELDDKGIADILQQVLYEFPV